MYFFVFKAKYFFLSCAICVLLVLGIGITAVTDVQTSAQMHDGVRVPILMYHSILKDPAAAGKYVVSPQTLETDLRYLKEQGYTTVRCADLAAYVREGKPLPEKPVMITFDDGHKNNLTYALPILEKLDMCAVVSVVGKYSEEFSQSEDHHPSYAYLSWEEIRALCASGHVEIGNHSYDMHARDGRKGTMKRFGEDKECYVSALKTDLDKTQRLLKQNCGIEPIVFAYPFGSICEESVGVIRDTGFLLSFGCAEKVNYITDEDSLYCLGRFNRPNGISTQEFMQRIEK